MKQDLERDTTFARKFVIAEGEADAFFAQAAAAKRESALPPDPTNAWMSALEKAGLDDIIFARNRAPAVEAWLSQEKSPPPRIQPKTKADQGKHVEDAQRIQAIRWKNFRPYPTDKSFEFGTVNLIAGVNGAGKTSLLEAIEAFYCGGTLRNGEEASSDVEARLGNTGKFLKLRHDLEACKARDMRWFGAYWRRKHELAANFNRYIFFNSDSAFKLEHDDGGQFVSSALANVALGPDATDLWGRIREFRKEFMVERERLKKRKQENDSHIGRLTEQTKQFKRAPLHSEAQLKALQSTLKDFGWKSSPRTLDEFEKQTCSQVLDIGSRFSAYKNLPTTVTLGKLDDFRVRAEAQLNLARRLRKSRADTQKVLDDLSKERANQSERKKERERLLEYFEAGWIAATRAERQHARVATHLDELLAEGQVSEHLDLLSEENGQTALSAISARLRKELAAFQADLTRARAASRRAERLSRSLRDLADEIRDLGRAFLQNAPDTVKCPLCGHVHRDGDLERLLHDETQHSQSLSPEAGKPLSTIKQLERAIADLDSQLDAISALKRFFKQSSAKDWEDQLITLAIVKTEVQRVSAALKNANTELSVARATLKALDRRGYSHDEFEELWKAAFGKKPTEDPEDDSSALQRLLKEVNAALRKLDESIAKQKTTIDDIDKAIRDDLSSSKGSRSLDALIEQRERDVETLRAFTKELGNSAKIFEAPIKLTVGEFLRILVAARDVSQQLLSSIATERSRQTALSGLEREQQAHEQAGSEISRRLQRADAAVGALGEILRKYDLESEVGRFIEANRTEISEILRAIHAPREFRGIAPLELSETGVQIRLQREGPSNSSVELSQISTGQRTALALAIFFTLNARVRLAPPIIMMDDPVAHVDDLNMLALLDYLRETAISGRRQIFFATANDKLAGIFEQKFTPLGSDFKNLPIVRTA